MNKRKKKIEFKYSNNEKKKKKKKKHLLEQIKNRASQIVQLKSQAQYYISNIRVQPERITLRETGTRGREKNKKKLTAMITVPFHT